jgi:hypothetical protein
VNHKRLIALLMILTFGLLAANGYGGWALMQARSNADIAIADAARCRSLSNQIVALKTKPTIAGTREQAQEELTARIEAAAKIFGITGDNLASITPEPAQRLADSVYLEKPTTIQLRQVTLAQVAGLLCRLATDGTGLRIKSLRLSAPPQSGNTDVWSAETTITYLIYSPQPTVSNKGDI